MKKIKDEKGQELEKKDEDILIEELLTNLRIKKNWTYLDVVDQLSKLGVMVEEKTIRKWEVGLEYPNLDIIYKLSELYYIPAEDFIAAKSNSYTKYYNSIHRTFIKWFCYLTGLSFKVAYVILYIALFLTLIGSFMFFINCCNDFIKVRQLSS